MITLEKCIEKLNFDYPFFIVTETGIELHSFKYWDRLRGVHKDNRLPTEYFLVNTNTNRFVALSDLYLTVKEAAEKFTELMKNKYPVSQI
jgi:hypothetical protein